MVINPIVGVYIPIVHLNIATFDHRTSEANLHVDPFLDSMHVNFPVCSTFEKDILAKLQLREVEGLVETNGEGNPVKMDDVLLKMVIFDCHGPC